jgi:hypothetical protein
MVLCECDRFLYDSVLHLVDEHHHESLITMESKEEYAEFLSNEFQHFLQYTCYESTDEALKVVAYLVAISRMWRLFRDSCRNADNTAKEATLIEFMSIFHDLGRKR